MLLEQKDPKDFPQLVFVAQDRESKRYVGWFDRPTRATGVYMACWPDRASVKTEKYFDVDVVEKTLDEALGLVREARASGEHDSGLPRKGIVLMSDKSYLDVD